MLVGPTVFVTAVPSRLVPTAGWGAFGPIDLAGAIPATATTLPLLAATGDSGLPLVGSASAPERSGALGALAAATVLYNLASADGAVYVNGTSGGTGLAVTVDLGGIVSPAPGVVGYPSVRYGVNPFCGTAAPSACTTPGASGLTLPLPVDRLPSLWATATFSVPTSTAGEYDVAYDLWLTRTPHPTAAGPGDVEIMVWLAYNDPAILPPGVASELAGTPSVPGGYVADRWASSHGWPVEYFVPTQVVTGTRTVTVDLAAALDATARALGGSDRSVLGGLYLDGIDLGTEFAPATGGDAVAYSWSLDAYSLAVA